MAEDNEHDILATKRAWKKHDIKNPLYIVNDGEECLDYLHQTGSYCDPRKAPKPGLIILDIDMPKMDGIAALKHIRKDKNYRHLPVVILTTSKAEEERIKSYDLGVNAYIPKPVGFEKFSKAINTIITFWSLVELP